MLADVFLNVGAFPDVVLTAEHEVEDHQEGRLADGVRPVVVAAEAMRKSAS